LSRPQARARVGGERDDNWEIQRTVSPNATEKGIGQKNAKTTADQWGEQVEKEAGWVLGVRIGEEDFFGKGPWKAVANSLTKSRAHGECCSESATESSSGGKTQKRKMAKRHPLNQGATRGKSTIKRRRGKSKEVSHEAKKKIRGRN